MWSYYSLKCKTIQKVSCSDKKKGRIMLVSKCEVCDTKKSKFMKEQVA